ncbi:MAG: oligopeptide/dipeptide transporter, ATPase subunit [Frankiales bacterium]|nr:oligopeptide/dipeptide transporter, ATPase subunit [Frankiales bacterium]
MALLEVDGLSVSFRTDDGIVRAVRDLSFTLEAGKTLGIVGESGSGKSVSTQTIMGLTRGAQISGRALFEGRDLLTMPTHELNTIRGRDIAMIFQDPLSSLHPHYTVGRQIEEVVRTHTDQTKKQARALAIDLLGRVGIPEPGRRVDDRPHQFSGGMRQRAMIAMALTLNPKLIIADEPTTALDVTVQAQILDLLAGLREEFNAALIMITHDLGVIAEIADDVMIMYAGGSIEFADRQTTYYEPHHPYTKGLIESIPAHTGPRVRLKPIQGTPPSLIQLPTGCTFHPRCTYVMDRCLTEVPPLVPVEGGARHRSACFLPPDEVGFGAEVEAARLAVAADRRPLAATVAEAAAVISADPADELVGLAAAPDADVRGTLVDKARTTRTARLGKETDR